VLLCRHEARIAKERKLQLPSDKPLPTVPGKEARGGSLQKGTSGKRDCGYKFYAKEYSKRPGTVIVTFHREAEDSVQSCSTMQHCTTAGLAAHAGKLVHDLQYTQEIQQIVVSKLKAHVMPKVIRQGGSHMSCDIMNKRQFDCEGHASYSSSHFKICVFAVAKACAMPVASRLKGSASNVLHIHDIETESVSVLEYSQGERRGLHNVCGELVV
jgi:hypothetical protein